VIESAERAVSSARGPNQARAFIHQVGEWIGAGSGGSAPAGT